MQATANGVIFVRAWIAVAIALTICAGGCRQVDTLGPGSGSISVDRPQSLPGDGEKATCRVVSSAAQTHQELTQSDGTSPTIASQRCPSPPPYCFVEVCRVPTDEAGESRSTAPGEIADEPAPVNCNTETLGAAGRPSYGECEPLPPNFGDAAKGLANLAGDSADASTGQPLPSADKENGGPGSRFGEILGTTRDNVFSDYANYYSRGTLGEFLVILAPAAVFANSDWDADVDIWYQEHVRSNATNRAASFVKPLGNGVYTIPFYVSAKFLGEYFDDWPGMALLGEFGDRSTRALAVGAPPLLAVQYLTGGGRPSDFQDNSYWRPFHASNGASGHAFMGAVPFLTLAGMTDDPLAKCFFYACSPWTGFSRINDNAHYLSQVWLGWWLAYLACDAVDKTEKGKGPLLITPLCTPDMTGVGVVYQH